MFCHTILRKFQYKLHDFEIIEMKSNTVTASSFLHWADTMKNSVKLKYFLNRKRLLPNKNHASEGKIQKKSF